MRSIILRFGLISGLILAGATAITLPLCLNGTIDMGNAQLLGYSIMVVAFIPVFLGIRAHRDANGGVISFGKAFRIGFLIALISSACYVATWEVMYFGGFVPGFEQKMEEVQMEKLRERGATGEEIARAQAQMAQFKEWYRNPLLNAAVTFLEPLPVALIISLVAAGILRRKPDDNRSSAVATA